MDSGNNNPDNNGKRLHTQEAIKKIAAMKNELKSILDNVIAFNCPSMADLPPPGMNTSNMASDLDVFYDSLSEPSASSTRAFVDQEDASVHGQVVEPDPVPAYSTSSEEVLNAFNFSKERNDADDAYDNLPSTPPSYTVLAGEPFQRVVKHPELLAYILLEPVNKALLENFMQSMVGKGLSASNIRSELEVWSARLPFLNDERTKLQYLRTSRSITQAGSDEISGMPGLVEAVENYFKPRTDGTLSAVAESISTVYNFVMDLDNDNPLELEDPEPPVRFPVRQRSVREAFQEQLLESVLSQNPDYDPPQPNAANAAWLYRLAGIQEFPGALIIAPRLSHSDQMTRLENEMRILEQESEEDLSVNSGPTPLSAVRSGLTFSSSNSNSRFPFYDTNAGQFKTSDGKRASMTLFAATGSNHKSLFPAIENKDIGQKLSSKTGLNPHPSSPSPSPIRPVVGPVPNDPVQAATTSAANTIDARKITVLTALQRSWEELPPRSELEVSPTTLNVEKAANTTSNSSTKIVEEPKVASKVPVKDSKGKDKSKANSGSARSSSPGRSRRQAQSAEPSARKSVVNAKASLSKLKIDRSKSSLKLLKTPPVSKSTTAKQPKRASSKGKSETVIPVVRGRPPTAARRPSKKTLVDRGVSYRAQNRESLERMQSRSVINTAAAAPTEKPEASCSGRSSARASMTRLPPGFTSSNGGQRDINANVVEESLEDQTFPSHLYIASEITFPLARSTLLRPKSPAPSDTKLRIVSPVARSPSASRTSSRTNTGGTSGVLVSRKPSSKLLTYAEMRKRKLESQQKAGTGPTRGIPSRIPGLQHKPQISLKINTKPPLQNQSRLPTPASRPGSAIAPAAKSDKPPRPFTSGRQY